MDFFEQNQNRREFLRSCARNFSLIAMGLGGGTLLARKQIKRSRHECINEGLCDGCGAFSGCILPQAMSAKENQMRTQRR
jgi:hypothetical protein